MGRWKTFGSRHPPRIQSRPIGVVSVIVWFQQLRRWSIMVAKTRRAAKLMAQSRPTRLLTTRWRAGVAVGLTACVLALALRDVVLSSHRRGLLLPLDFWLHGWPLIAANVIFYGYLCWLAFWFIRGSHGRERVFIVGWFSATLLPPLELLQRG